MSILRPLLKWPGGKHKLAPALLGALPPEVRGLPLVEPFLGSGAFSLAHQGQNGILSDLNGKLVTFHQIIRDDPEGLIAAIGRLPTGKDWRDHFYTYRTLFNGFSPMPGDKKLQLELATMFLWLNRGAFNGLYRENKAGHFNAPVGAYSTLAIPTPEHVMDVSRALQGYTIRQDSFQSALARLVTQEAAPSLVYLDPPYDPVSKTSSFTAYAGRPFTWEDQQCLANLAGTLVAQGHWVLASNHNTDRIRSLWESRGFTLRPITGVRRSISCKASTRGSDVPECYLVRSPDPHWSPL